MLTFLSCSFICEGVPQVTQLTGTVKDKNTGETISGIVIHVTGTAAGTRSGADGRFSMNRPPAGSEISFSHIGYSTEIVTYYGGDVLDMEMVPITRTLDEVVIVGYGTVKKSDVTGSVSSVSSANIEKSQSKTIQSALQGLVPGLEVTSSSGSPGSEPVVLLRGVGTVNNNSPVYVVDGMILDPSQSNDATNIRYLNPSDISNIEVLKDASAQAIYGSRGANGVILITTRKGSEGMPRLTLTSSTGFSNIARLPEVLSRDEFKDYIITCYTNGYLRSHPGETSVTTDILRAAYPAVENTLEEYNAGTYTDWMKEILLKNSPTQNYNLSVQGGSRYSHYFASAGYLDDRGLIKRIGFSRYSFRMNTDFTFKDFLSLGENAGITCEKKTGYNNDIGAFGNAMLADPLAPVLKPAGSVDPADPDYDLDKFEVSKLTEDNPLFELQRQNIHKTGLTIVGNFFGEINILKNLKLRSSWGFNDAIKEESDYSPTYYLSPVTQNQVSELTALDLRSSGWIWENTVSWKGSFKAHTFAFLAGYTSEYLKAIYQSSSKEGTPSNSNELQTFDAATSNPEVSGSYKINTMNSVLGRINYSMLDKYLITASLRYDGSSKFGPGHRWGAFPSFSLAWKAGKEQFMKSLNKLFNDFKLRAGWGRIGNSNLPVYYAFLSQVSVMPADWWTPNRYVFGEQVYNGYSLSLIGTKNLSWETTEQTNIGIDLSMLENKLTITADYYIRHTKDMILQVPLPGYSGYPANGAPYTNAGSVRNKGLEIAVVLRGRSGNFSWEFNGVASSFRNLVTSLGYGDKPVIYNWNRTEKGMPIACFYGYKTNGIFQSEEMVQEYKSPTGKLIQPDAHAGDFRFKDLNGDYIIDDKDQTWIGNPWPKMTYGLNADLIYKEFDLMLLFQGSYRNDIFDFGLWRHLNFTGTGQEFKYIYKNAWKGPGSSDTNPLLTTVDQNDNYRGSDFFIEDGSYLRLKSLEIGYNLPPSLCSEIRVEKARLWAGATNLLTFTAYKGLDPETGAVSINPSIMAGNDLMDRFPQSREISIGMTLTF